MKSHYIAALVTAFLVSGSSLAAAQRLAVPPSVPVDEPVPIRVSGLRGGTRIVLRATDVDGRGRQWFAVATFRALADGTIDTGRDAPVSGDYDEADAGGLFNRMRAIGDTATLLRFSTANVSTLSTAVTLEDAGGRTLDSAIVERYFRGSGVTLTPVAERGVQARLFAPRATAAPGIVVLGGSEGGFADGLAALLATRGYHALSLAYFGVDGLPAELDEIPLESVARAVAWLRAQPGVRGNRVALFGTSKGAEAALLVASHVPGVHAVVAYAPSSVAWSCICRQAEHSSWTLGGSPVASVPPGNDPTYRPARGEPIRPAVHYRHRMGSAQAEVAIPIERFRGPLLLVAGGDDQLWPSLLMAEALMQRRQTLGGHTDDQLQVYPRAGHLIGKTYLPAASTRVAGGRLETGGTPEANARAQADAWPKALAFLAKALEPR